MSHGDMKEGLLGKPDPGKKMLYAAEDTGKHGNNYLRFTILYAVVLVGLALVPFWASYVIPDDIALLNAIVVGCFTLVWIIIAICAVRNFLKVGHTAIPPIDCIAASKQRKFKHIVIVPCYVDPIEVLFAALSSLMIQQNPEDLVVVVTFEAKTPNLREMKDTVELAFKDKFGDLLVIVHILDPAKEIPGGCSNKNFALRAGFDYCQANHPEFHNTKYIMTTCDTDSLFHPLHFKTLEEAYNADNPSLTGPPKMCVYQPPTFYNWDLDQRPFFVRVTGIMRTMMMLGGLISFDLNPMSIFSYPLELGLVAGFINPRYGVDDIIAKVRWMCDTNSAVPVQLLPIPVISGPTIGDGFIDEAVEWGRQIRRWIVGSSESFHYFVIHFKGKPFFAGLQWAMMFFAYYGILLCCASVFMIIAAFKLPWVTYPEETILFDFFGWNFQLTFRLADACTWALGIQYLVFGVAFLIDWRGTKMMGIKEDINILRNIMHWILAPLVLTCYSLIAFVSIIRFVFIGKGFAGHDASNHEGLQASLRKHVEDALDTRKQSKAQTNEPLCRIQKYVYFGSYRECTWPDFDPYDDGDDYKAPVNHILKSDSIN